MNLMTNFRRANKQVRRSAGFSLVELLLAMAVFLIVGGAAFTLLQRHQPLFNQEQDLASLNVGMRNAMSQLQIDLGNAGTGFFVGANVPSWPIGVTIVNSNAGAGCYDPATNTYSANCFDRLNIIAVDPNVPPMHPRDIGTNCVSTTSSILFADPPTNPPMTAAQAAAQFLSGDQILLVRADGSQMTSVVLTQNADVSGGKVRIQHNPTGANGSNSSSMDDPLGITTNPNNKLGSTFCDTDWLLKLSPIRYSVDTTDPRNPKLTRTQNAVTDTVMEQVVGFKVGASLWNNAMASSTEEYNYDASTFGPPPGFDYTLVRSVRVSLIGRTIPSSDPTYRFRNPFDQGPYQIQGASVVVNPRNLSMRD